MGFFSFSAPPITFSIAVTSVRLRGFVLENTNTHFTRGSETRPPRENDAGAAGEDRRGPRASEAFLGCRRRGISRGVGLAFAGAGGLWGERIAHTQPHRPRLSIAHAHVHTRACTPTRTCIQRIAHTQPHMPWLLARMHMYTCAHAHSLARHTPTPAGGEVQAVAGNQPAHAEVPNRHGICTPIFLYKCTHRMRVVAM